MHTILFIEYLYILFRHLCIYVMRVPSHLTKIKKILFHCHSGCIGDLYFGINGTTTSFIPLIPVTGVQVTRCSN